MSEETTTEAPKLVGTITIQITEDEISYDSELDIANIVFFLELVKEIILKQSMEKN